MGKRFKTYLILAIAMAFMVFSFGPVVADQSKVPLVGGGQSYLPLDDFVLESESPTIAGDSWYVDSGKSASGDGKSWDYAVITINEAYDLATTSNGDAIHVAPNSDETIDAATDLVCDKIGITIIGYGSGSECPTLSWATAAAATIPVSGADNVFRNIIFDGSSTAADGPDAMFTVTAAGFQLIRSEVIISDATEAATVVITGSAAADRMKILGNRFFGTITGAGIGCNSAVAFTGAAEDIEIAYNTFEGDFAEGALDSGSVVTQMNVHNNYIWNAHDGVEAIHFDGAVTGTIAYNQLVTDAYATAIDAGSCDVFETYWASDAAHDVMATPVLTHEDGAVLWSATELTQMQLEVDEALQAENLDHLLALLDGATHVYPENAVEDSILCKILGDDDPAVCTTYDNSTDSLEALGNLVADTNQQSNVVAANVTDLLDHIAKTIDGGTNAYPDSPVNESIIAYILSKSAEADVSSYDNQKDSLEALRDNQDEGVLLGAGVNLDHLVLSAVATDFATTVHLDSVIGNLADVGSSATYTRSTDSLEAIRDNIDTLNAADQVDLDAILADTISISGAVLPDGPTTDSLASFIASGGTALGTNLGDSASIVDAIGADGVAILTPTAGSLYGASGQVFIVEKTLTSSAILTSGVDVTAVASGGDVYIEDIIMETNGTGLATGTNFTLEKDAGSGVLTFLAEAVINLGVNATVTAENGSVTPCYGTVVESGQKIVAKCTSASCDGAGTITLYIKARRVADGANLTPAP